MNNWDWILGSPFIPALGWTMLHSIWQILLLGIVAYLGLKNISAQKAQFRYLFSYTILLIIGGLFIWNFNHQYQIAAAQKTKVELYSDLQKTIESDQTLNLETTAEKIPLAIEDHGSNPDLIQKENIFSFAKFLSSAKHFFKTSLPWLALIWVVGVLILGLKLIGSWLYLKHWAKRMATPVDTHWQHVLVKLKHQLGLRVSIQFLESANIYTPLTFGWLKPIIMIPLGMLSQLSPDQIEAVLLHELAHIRRFDFIANVLQSFVGILLFFHPVVWWISRKIRESREDCCDDIAVTHCQNKFLYAASLLQIQKYSLTSKNQIAMAAIGNSGRLTARIQRLFLNTKKENHFNSNRVSPFLTLLLIFSFLSLYAFTDLFSVSNKTVSIAVDKMNVFYIGVNNPITVAVAGIPTDKIRLSSKDVVLENKENGHYNVMATTSGKATIQVSGDGLETAEIIFRVKHLPLPKATLKFSDQIKSGGTAPAEEFQKIKEVNLSFANFNFDINMTVLGFKMTRVPKNGDPVDVIVTDGYFNEKVKNLIEMAKPGDIYYFDNVQVNWKDYSGKEDHDFEPNKVNSMVFKII
jgi:beta-lactamase regulating signal transducer with metallopeptidase domain